MKRLIAAELDGLIPHPDEDHPDESQRPTEAAKKQLGSPRRYLRVMFLNPAPASIEQSDQYNQIQQKLKIVGDVDFEEAEFNSIFEKVRNNVMQWSAFMHHHIVEIFRNAEKRKLEVKIDEVK